MTRLAKRLLVVLAGVVVMTLAMALTIYLTNGQRGPQEGMLLVFEMTDAKGDAAAEIAAVRRRLAGVTGATVSAAGAGRLSVWLPYPRALELAWGSRRAALEEFRKTELSPARLEALLKAREIERSAELARVAPAGGALHEELARLVAAADRYAAVKRSAASAAAVVLTAPGTAAVAAASQAADAMEQAARELDAARGRAYERMLDVPRLTALLAEAEEPGNTEAVRRREELVVRYPAQATEILHVIAAQRAWAGAGGLNRAGPEEVERLLLAKGELEFRILVQPGELGKLRGVDDYREAVESLQAHGPNVPVRTSAGMVRWCEVGEAAEVRGNMAAGFAAGREYVLGYDDHGRTLTHEDAKYGAWTVRAGDVREEGGRAIVPFTLDGNGATYMADLTRGNKGRVLAMVVDGRVVSAPTIQSQLGGEAEISFAGRWRREAAEVQEVLRLAPLPAGLRRVP